MTTEIFCTATANTTLDDYSPGDVVRISNPDTEIDENVVIVIDKGEPDDVSSKRSRIKCFDFDTKDEYTLHKDTKVIKHYTRMELS